MLGFIPKLDKATILKKDLAAADRWGVPSYVESYTGKCQLTFKEDLAKVSQLDGKVPNHAITILFRGNVDVSVGDKIRFMVGGEPVEDNITSVHKLTDWGNKVFATRVVSGAAKRDY